jgi:hypothetical protein
MHFLIEKLFISGKDPAVNAVSTTLKAPGACAIKVGMSPAYEITCTASIDGQEFAFACAAEAQPDILRVCPAERPVK